MAGKLSHMVGKRGERIAELALTNYEHFGESLFDPVPLGDRRENVDLFVEFTMPGGKRAFFLAQVKSTSSSQPGNGGLRIKMATDKWNLLVRYRCPVFVIGVHEPTKAVFVAAANRRRTKGLSRLYERNQLLPSKLKLLYQEVVSFWRLCPKQRPASKFKP